MEILEIIGVPYFKKGKGIHIKKKNRGKFTEYCGGKVTDECIKRAKKSKNPALRKRATFADNARKWKHTEGGIIKAQQGTMFLTPHPLSPVGIAVNQAKANAKNKKDQTHLPPGVKEVIGPDGKKIAIRTEQPLKPLEQSIAEWLPGIGDVAEVGYIANDVKNDNLGSALLGATLIAIPGNVGKIKRSLPELSFRRTPTYGQMKVRDLANYAKNSGLDKLSDDSFLSLKQLIQDAQNGSIHGSNYQRIARMIDDDLRKFEKPKGKPLNRWQQPFDEMIPMENFGHRRKTTDNFKLSDYYKRGGNIELKVRPKNTNSYKTK